MSRSKSSGGLVENIKTILWAVLIAITIRTVAFEPFNIPSGSMIPTLLVGDYLFVSKYSYGYSRFSLPYGLDLFPGRIFYREPARGDVAVFKLPTDGKTDYIKRIIGLPGDTVQMIGGVLHLNGQAVRRERVADEVEPRGTTTVRIVQYVETLPNGKRHRIREERGDDGGLDNTPPYAVPAGHFFAMGDNRDNSQDSRVLSEVGFIPAENLVGRAEILFFSTDGSARWFEFWKWPTAIRYGRLFNTID